MSNPQVTLKLQKSIVRTNCMDCLDRTNVVQSILAKRALMLQLQEMGIVREDQHIEHFYDFELLFRQGFFLSILLLSETFTHL